MWIVNRIRTTVLIAAAALAVTTTALASAAGNRTLIIAIEPWAPFAAPDLPRDGFLSVLTRAAFEAAGHESRVEFLPWARALLEVTQGDRDALMGLYYTAERAKHYWYTDSVYQTKVGLVTLDDFPVTSFDSLRDLIPYSIGVGRGFANSKKFDSADYLNKQIVKSQRLNVRKLFANRVDMIVGSFDRIRAMVRGEGHPVDRLSYLEPALKAHDIHVGISRALEDGEQIRDAFNRGLARIRENGRYQRILEEYGIAQ